MLVFGLDAFGEDRNLQAVTEPDNRADDRHRVVIVFQIGNEGAIDLDLVEGEGVQIGQRRIAGAEVVQRNLHAERLEPAQDRHRAGEVVDQHALGYFQLQPRRRQPGLQQDGVNETRQIAVMELDRRNIDRDDQRFGPARRLAAGLAQRPFAERNNEAALLGDRDKGRRRHHAPGRAVPAGQRLEADDFAGDVKLRLVVQQQFAMRDCMPQVELQIVPLLQQRAHFRLEEHQRCLSRRFRLIERGVGMGHQRLGIRAVGRIDGAADAQADLD